MTQQNQPETLPSCAFRLSCPPCAGRMNDVLCSSCRKCPGYERWTMFEKDELRMHESEQPYPEKSPAFVVP